MHETTSNERKPRGYGWSFVDIIKDFEENEWPAGVPRHQADPNYLVAADEAAKADFQRAKERLKARIRAAELGERAQLELRDFEARVKATIEDEDRAKLEAKQRVAEQDAKRPSAGERLRRAAPATVGDLEDLRAEVERLSEIVARLER